MTQHMICDKLPYTVSIQFDNSVISDLNNSLREYKLSNRIGTHISLKYLGYQEELTNERLSLTLSRLNETRHFFVKFPIKIMGFDFMDNINPFFNKLLYLRVSPRNYLYGLHKKIIEVLEGLTDTFEAHDFQNFIPHISCGYVNEVNDSLIMSLNKIFFEHSTITIEDWDLVLHTSEQEFLIL